VLERIDKNPEIAISILYTLVLNSENNQIDKNLYEKIVKEYILKSEGLLNAIN